jgi:glucose/arabinose dehydrogenase
VAQSSRRSFRVAVFAVALATALATGLAISGAATAGAATAGTATAGGPGSGLSPAVHTEARLAGEHIAARSRDDLVVASSPALAAAFDPTKVSVGLSLVKSGFVDPVLVTNAGDGRSRLFVVEQAGRIRIIDGGTVLATPFLDLRGAITSGGERGLLGLAFHPNFATHPYIYVNFTDRNGNTAINRYRVSVDPNVVDRATGVRILTISQPYANHNGGNLAFGPDGYLYIGMGDGGSAGDPGGRAQNLRSLLGKMLRIDVDHTSGTKHYRSPATNPYVGKTGLDEIWSRGLRNPWRWSFDAPTGQLWIGDVGQGRWEEIDRSLRVGTSPAGRATNYGWNVMEGRACFKPATGCSTSGKKLPLVTYGHSVAGADNCSVTGGFVYRGSAYPALVGGYVFGDFCSGRIWLLSAMTSTPATVALVRGATASPHLAISSFGRDEAGELYVCDLAGGAVYRITASPKP